jgi:hypothetical protein
MNKNARHTASEALPLERSYLSLQEAFEQAISLEVLLARRRGAAVDAAREAPGDGLDPDAPQLRDR